MNGSGSGSGCRSGDAYTDWVLASALPLFPSTYFGTRFIDRPAWGRTKVRLPYFIGTILDCIVCIAVLTNGPASAAGCWLLGAGECVHVRRGLCCDGAGCFLPRCRDTNVHVSTMSTAQHRTAQHSTAQHSNPLTHSSTQYALPLPVHYRTY